MRKTIAFLLSFMLAFTASLSFAEEPIAVRVNNRTFTRQQVQKYINQVMLSVELTTGETLTSVYADDEQAQFLSDAAEHFVSIGVLREKLQQAGQEELTEAERDMLNEYARTSYEQVWNELSQRVAEAYPDMELSASFVTEVLEEAGYSMNDIYEMGLLAIQEQRLFDLYCADVTYTDEELQAYYDEHFVAPDREKYQNNIGQYEADLVLGGGSSAYTPEGFFFVKYIALAPSSDCLQQINAAEAELEEAQRSVDEVNAAVVDAVLNNGDVDALRVQAAQAQEAAASAQAALDAARVAAAADFEPLMELVTLAASDGVAFDELMERYSDGSDSREYSDEGYPFHPQSVLLDPMFVQHAASMQKEGDLVGPFFAGEKVFIVYRARDIAGGAYIPDEESMEAMRSTLLYERQTERLNELTAQWRNEMDVMVDLTGLEFPQY